MKIGLLHPELFQGNLSRKNYFEGFYYKHVSADLEHVWSFIPGISLNVNDKHAFIQAINGRTGETHYFVYDPGKFSWSREKVHLKVGDSIFTDEFMILRIDSGGHSFHGKLQYVNPVRFPKKILSPGIMGWYSFVPYMECKHGIVSANHEIYGTLDTDGFGVVFDGGSGYIEKDWGTSFPDFWIWMQTNNFSNKTASFSFSVAKIPWLGRFFIGFISFLYLNGRFHIFSTYNKSTLKNISHDDTFISLTLANREVTLDVSVERNRSGELLAPTAGMMSRRIRESIDSTVSLRMCDKNGTLLFSDTGKRAGLEVTGDIFSHL